VTNLPRVKRYGGDQVLARPYTSGIVEILKERETSIANAVTMLFVANPIENCAEYQELAADRYVLYHIHCKTGNDNFTSPHLFLETEYV
jgi:hypothetical protein